MKATIFALKWTAWSTAIGSVTMTPLMGFVVGDKRPSAAATALQLLIAVLLMSSALVITVVDQAAQRRKRATGVHRHAAAGPDSGDRFAATRKQAHDAGLPWIEADGAVSWPPDQARTDTATNRQGGRDV